MAERRRNLKDESKIAREKTKAKGGTSSSGNAEGGEAGAVPECAVCLQICVHPARLPCSHIFCFLCLKGLATQSRRCAMCRQEIPVDYVDHPDLLEHPNTSGKEAFEDGYQWFYEGRSGWWQYDERTSRELEIAYKSGQRTCELLIVGQLYIADFDAMLQLRKNDMSRRRRIKRDLASIPIKGIAGLRIEGTSNVSEGFQNSEEFQGIHAPSTSQQAVNSRHEPDQSLPQVMITPAGVYDSHDVSWQQRISHVHYPEDDDEDGNDNVTSEDILDDDADLEVEVDSSEDREHEYDENLDTTEQRLRVCEPESEDDNLLNLSNLKLE